jgi:hypothetical protein
MTKSCKTCVFFVDADSDAESLAACGVNEQPIAYCMAFDDGVLEALLEEGKDVPSCDPVEDPAFPYEGDIIEHCHELDFWVSEFGKGIDIQDGEALHEAFEKFLKSQGRL